MDKAALQTKLENFTGTENWHRWNPLFRNILLTDGVKYLADNAGCYWLLDILGSVQNLQKIKCEEFQVLKFNKGTMLVTIEDGNDNVLYEQKMDYTNFPLDEIAIWFANTETEKIIYLPSEH